MNTGKMHEHDSQRPAEVLLVAIEMSLKNWRLAMAPFGAQRHRQIVIEAGNYLKLQEAVGQAQQRFGLAKTASIMVCYEAGREGFHPYRVLSEAGWTVWIVDSSSIEVNRRQRRAKCDGLDAPGLLGLMQRRYAGERRALRLLRVPSCAQEDERHLTRERDELRVERGRLRVRMQSLLFTHGVRDFPKRAGAIEHWLSEHAAQLPAQLCARLQRELQRLQLVEEQLHAIDQQQRHSYAAAHDAPITLTVRTAQQLCRLKGIAECSAGILSSELFGWRKFHNRREVGSVVGLAPTPYDSGESHREQGISKAGNKRVRRVIVEVAWKWLRYQPRSALTRWYLRRFAGQGKRGRRVGIVALARRLLVALWHYLEHQRVPEGAILKGAA